jgi:hypothetical protein
VKGQIGLLLKGHYALGYSGPLLIFDCFLLFWLALDVVRFLLEGYSLAPVIAPPFFNGRESLPPAFLFVAFAMLVVPIPIAVWRSTGFGSAFFRGRLAAKPMLVMMIHGVVCLFFVYATMLSHDMQILSGFELTPDQYRPSFNSHFYGLIFTGFFIIKHGFEYLAAGFALIASTVFGWILLGREFPKTMQQYLVRLDLAGLPPELRVVKADPHAEQDYFLSPVQVEYVAAEERRILAGHMRLRCGSKQSTDYLDQLFSECRKTVLQELIQCVSSDTRQELLRTWDFGLFTGTPRAFEAALGWMAPPRTIVVSPYASPSLVRMVQWRSAAAGDAVHVIAFQPDDYLRLWSEQEEIILREVARARAAAQPATAQPNSPTHSGEKAGTIVLLLSEVFYATGLRVPLRSFLERLRAQSWASDLQVIVDGTNAAGNGELIAGDAAWDHYVFGPHRWLLCNQRCGVLVSRQNLNALPPPPNIWRVGQPKTPAQSCIIAALSAALSLPKSGRLKPLRQRSQKLREYFKLNLPSNAHVIGLETLMSESFILSCSPAPAHGWKFRASELADMLAKESLPASIVTLTPNRPWLRIAISFHRDIRDLNRLSSFLEAVIG